MDLAKAAAPTSQVTQLDRGTHLCWVRFRVPGSGFQVGFQVPGSFQVPCSRVPGSKCRVPDIAVAPIEPATNLELGTKEPGTVEPPGNLERTRNEEPNLEPRTRNRGCFRGAAHLGNHGRRLPNRNDTAMAGWRSRSTLASFE